jgi:hypothetical protein
MPLLRKVIAKQICIMLLMYGLSVPVVAQISSSQSYVPTSAYHKVVLVNTGAPLALSFSNVDELCVSSLPSTVLSADKELLQFQSRATDAIQKTDYQLQCLNTLGALSNAKIAIKNKQFATAQYWYSQAQNIHLSNQQLVEKNFNSAYALLQQNENLLDSNTSKAISSLMNGIRNIPGQYSNAGNYYYGMLQYVQCNYKACLQSLEPILTDKNYQALLYYPIAHAQYELGQITNCEKTIQQSLNLPKAARRFEAQIVHLAMQVLYEQEKFTDVITYGNMIGDVRAIIPSQRFAYAYSALQTQDLEVAKDAFLSLQSDTNALLATHAYYFAGLTLLAKKDSAGALKQFAAIAESPYLQEKEQTTVWQNIAALSYAKTDDETAYLFAYKLAKHKDEVVQKNAIKMLADLSLRSANKQTALKELLPFANNADAAEVVQKIAYSLAVQNLSDGQFDELDNNIKLCRNYPQDQTLLSEVNYLSLASAYKQKKWHACIDMQSFAVPTNRLCDVYWLVIHSHLNLYQLDSVKKIIAAVDSFQVLKQCKADFYQASWSQLKNIFNAEQLIKTQHSNLLDSIKNGLKTDVTIRLVDSVLHSTLCSNTDSIILLTEKSNQLFISKNKSEAYKLFSTLPPQIHSTNYIYLRAMITEAKAVKDSALDYHFYTEADTPLLVRSKDYFEYKNAVAEYAIWRRDTQCGKELLQQLLLCTTDNQKKKSLTKEIKKL